MIRSLLGQEIDIHTGGEDLKPVHHNNEIAQSEAASGRTFSHYWLHNAFLTMNGEKASKSIGNVVYLREVLEKGFSPLALRYFFLQGHYRTPLSFSWDALGGAAEALNRLWKIARDIGDEANHTSAPSEARARFLAALRDDLATPQALGILWDALRSEEYSPEEKWGLIEDADTHLGLSLVNPPVVAQLLDVDIPEEIRTLVASREEARRSKDFGEADRIRVEILNRGYRVEDGPLGPVLTKSAV
jgi:cysteinyl-tRNA synthetase